MRRNENSENFYLDFTSYFEATSPNCFNVFCKILLQSTNCCWRGNTGSGSEISSCAIYSHGHAPGSLLHNRRKVRVFLWKGIRKNIISYYSSAFSINPQPRRRSVRSHKSVFLIHFSSLHVLLIQVSSLHVLLIHVLSLYFFFNPCFINRVHVLPIQSRIYFITCHIIDAQGRCRGCCQQQEITDWKQSLHDGASGFETNSANIKLPKIPLTEIYGLIADWVGQFLGPIYSSSRWKSIASWCAEARVFKIISFASSYQINTRICVNWRLLFVGRGISKEKIW